MVLLRKGQMGSLRVGTHSKNFAIQLREDGIFVAELAHLFASQRGVIFWIEEENNVSLSEKIGQTNGFSVLVGKRKIGGGITNIHVSSFGPKDRH